MGNPNVREAMAAERTEREESAIEPTTKTADKPIVSDPMTEPIQAKEASSEEPDEEQFEDRADYKKALKEWTKKQTEAEVRDAHRKELDGQFAQLRKAREQKRELNLKLDELNSRVNQSSKPVKPDINAYSDPDAYANDVVKYDRIVRQNEANDAQAVSHAQASESEEIDAVWEHNAKASGLTDIDQVIAHVQQTKLLSPLPAHVQKDLVLSVAGPHMLRFLDKNPAFVDEIAESENPRLEMKKLEGMMIESLRNAHTLKATPQPAPVVAPVAPVVSPKFAPMTVPKAATSQTSTANKNRAQAGSMAEFMRLRDAERRKK